MSDTFLPPAIQKMAEINRDITIDEARDIIDGIIDDMMTIDDNDWEEAPETIRTFIWETYLRLVAIMGNEYELPEEYEPEVQREVLKERATIGEYDILRVEDRMGKSSQVQYYTRPAQVLGTIEETET